MATLKTGSAKLNLSYKSQLKSVHLSLEHQGPSLIRWLHFHFQAHKDSSLSQKTEADTWEN